MSPPSAPTRPDDHDGDPAGGPVVVGDDELVRRARADVRCRNAHFNHAGASLVPAPAIDRMVAHLGLEAELGGYEAAASVADELAAVPASLARLIGGRADEVTIVEGASRGWADVLWALAESRLLAPGDRVLIDRFCYVTVHATLMHLRHAHGIEVELVPSHDDGTVDVEALTHAVGRDGSARLVAVTHMPTHVGTLTDAVAVGRALGGADVLYALDVSQTLGQLPVDVGEIGCHIAFAPGRKFLRAPRGTGLLYVEAGLAEQLVPLALPFGSVDPAHPDRFTLPPAARRFDQFEFGVAARLGLGVAAEYALTVGLDRISPLVSARSRDVTGLLSDIPGVHLVGGADARGIVSFVHESLPPDQVRQQILAAAVNVWVNPAGGSPLDAAVRPVLPSVRVSPHYLTDADDLERLARALAGLS